MTSKVYVAARQHGKSIMQKQALSALFDSWENELAKKAEPEYLDYSTPPLAYVIAMQETGKESWEIYSTLQDLGHMKIVMPETAVKESHHAAAADIYSYFAKKHTLRRIKGDHMSKFMLVVEDLCENRKRVNVEHLRALISLPRIYNQNRNLERVMKGRRSVPKPNQLHFPKIDCTVEFVDKIHLQNNGSQEYHYFFSLPNNCLMRVVLRKGDYGVAAWDNLIKTKKLYIKAGSSHIYNMRGYDFNVIQPNPEDMEITVL